MITRKEFMHQATQFVERFNLLAQVLQHATATGIALITLNFNCMMVSAEPPARASDVQGATERHADGIANAGNAPEAINSDKLPGRFHLTPQQEQYLAKVLETWQDRTKETKTFRCEFVRWNYNPAFELPQFKDVPLVVNNGDLKYANPDKGTFRVTRVMNLDTKTGEYKAAKDIHGEHWVCDGASIWQHDHKNKRVIERRIPEEMQGEAIRNTPLPFLFGSQAADLKKRYFLCIVTPREYAQKEIWVDAVPRTKTDSGNFREAILRLDRNTFEPIALRVYDPGDTYATYEFSNVVINDPFEGIKRLFAPPSVPFGWQKIVEMPAEATARRTVPGGETNSQGR
ncbi:MAG: TIGR03009 domain-containing protein [Planctomycetota bacterium]|nr:TIGR03009 domain-containing protein [Planctomycetota bacterium]